MRATRTHYNASNSYEPTVSGYSQTPEDRDRETMAIVAEDPDQYDIFKAIKDIDSIYLNPWGRLPDRQRPETRRFFWQRRTPENIWPVVWCRINVGARDVLFEIQLSRYEYCTAHVPVDSWTRRTCDSEAVRAAIQQDHLNRLRGVRHYTIVKQGMKSLPLLKPIFVPSFATREAVDDERRQHRIQQSRPPFSSPSSSYAPQYREVYGHHHARHSYNTLEPYSPSQTLVEEWPQYRHGYGRRHHYQTSQWSSRSSNSSRTLVQEDWEYGFEDDYSDTSSSYSTPPPPRRSEKHSRGLTRSIRSDSEGSSIYSADDIHPQERKRWWQRM